MAYSTTKDAKGICPTGWHIPAQAEFDTLAAAVGNNGNSLKAVGQGTDDGTGNNTGGFSVLLVGERDCYGVGFKYLGDGTVFWSSTKYYATYAYLMYAWGSDSSIYVTSNNKLNGYSIRCIKDN